MILFLISIIFINGIDSSDGKREIYVCESSDPNLIGIYKESSELVDGAPIYTNNKVSVYFLLITANLLIILLLIFSFTSLEIVLISSSNVH